MDYTQVLATAFTQVLTVRSYTLFSAVSPYMRSLTLSPNSWRNHYVNTIGLRLSTPRVWAILWSYAKDIATSGNNYELLRHHVSALSYIFTMESEQLLSPTHRILISATPTSLQNRFHIRFIGSPMNICVGFANACEDEQLSHVNWFARPINASSGSNVTWLYTRIVHPLFLRDSDSVLYLNGRRISKEMPLIYPDYFSDDLYAVNDFVITVHLDEDFLHIAIGDDATARVSVPPGIRRLLGIVPLHCLLFIENGNFNGSEQVSVTPLRTTLGRTYTICLSEHTISGMQELLNRCDTCGDAFCVKDGGICTAWV